MQCIFKLVLDSWTCPEFIGTYLCRGNSVSVAALPRGAFGSPVKSWPGGGVTKHARVAARGDYRLFTAR